MTYRLLLVTPALVLAACGSGGGGSDVSLKNASVNEVSEKAQATGNIQPGQWETTTEIVSVEMPGMQGPAGDAMKKQMAGRRNSSTECITPEEAAKPSFAGKDDGECRYDTFEMAGGRVNAKMTCKPSDTPAESHMTLAGTYTPTEYAMDASTEAVLPGNQSMKMAIKIQGRRIGECPAG